MDEVSIGPDTASDQPIQPGVDAQKETERDMDHAVAGPEAKPFSVSAKDKAKAAAAPAAGADGKKPAPDAQENLIANRRNPGRE